MKTTLIFRAHSKRAKSAHYLTSVLVLINFFALIAGSLYLGGGALNGYIKVAHYFICAHGHCAEVSRSVWHCRIALHNSVTGCLIEDAPVTAVVPGATIIDSLDSHSSLIGNLV